MIAIDMETGNSARIHRNEDILLLIFSIACIAGFISRGINLCFSFFLRSRGADNEFLASAAMSAAAMFFCAVIFIPLVTLTIRRLKQQNEFALPKMNRWGIIGLGVAWLAALLIAFNFQIDSPFTWFAGIPSFLAGISIPILGIYLISARSLGFGSQRSIWVSLAYGMVGGTLGSMLLEVLAGGGFLLAAVIWADNHPEISILVAKIQAQISTGGSTDIQTILTILSPFLKQPVVIISLMAFASLITPIIEESLKPAILWFIGKRLASPVQGFILGAACGAGFAMLEGFLAASNAPQVLGFGILGRAAASWMHITSSAILGWGIASFRLEKKKKRLFWTWMAAIAIHGLWNGSAVLAVLGAAPYVLFGQSVNGPETVMMVLGGSALFTEFVLILVALPVMNRFMLKTIQASTELVSDIIAPLDTKE